MEYGAQLTPQEITSLESQLLRGMAKRMAGDGCLYWLGRRNKQGYGVIDMYWPEAGKKRVVTVGKAILALRLGYWPRRLDYACHTCDNTSCCADDHIYHGNPQSNMDDMIDRGRRAKKHRYHHRERKYSSDKIDKAKAALKAGMTMSLVSKVFGISPSYVNAINYGKQKRVEGEIYPLSIPRSIKGVSIAIEQNRLAR